MCSHEQAEADLANALQRAIAAGGQVLMPVPAVGISQELILLLERFTKSGDLQTKVLVEKIISEATSVYEAYPEFLSKELGKHVLQSETSQFGPQFSIVESNSLKPSEPVIVTCSFVHARRGTVCRLPEANSP